MLRASQGRPGYIGRPNTSQPDKLTTVRIYDLRDESGQLRGFEIGNGLLQRGAVRRSIAEVPGARMIPLPTREERLDGEFCRFQVGQTEFVAFEPFNDKSRYWIGSKDGMATEATEALRLTFANFELAGWFRLARATGASLAAFGIAMMIAGWLALVPAATGTGFALFVGGGLVLVGLWIVANSGSIGLSLVRQR